MDNQHQKITGYRDLSQKEIDLINDCKELAAQCGKMIEKLQVRSGIDQRSVSIAKTTLQQGFMWLIRSIAQPDSF